MITPHYEKFCFSINDAAALMSVGRRTIYREISSGRLNTAKMGKRTLVPADAIRDWLKAASSKPTQYQQKGNGR
jgi:excisionase family DNA binding protein